jgi:hypothetical protein
MQHIFHSISPAVVLPQILEKIAIMPARNDFFSQVDIREIVTKTRGLLVENSIFRRPGADR